MVGEKWERDDDDDDDGGFVLRYSSLQHTYGMVQAAELQQHYFLLVVW